MTPHLFANLSQLGLPPEVVRQLRHQHGIVTVGQLYDQAVRVARLLNTDSASLCARLKTVYPEIDQRGSVEFNRPPLTGLAGPTEGNQILAQRRRESAVERSQIGVGLQRLADEDALPTHVQLAAYLPPVFDQGPYGYCVGPASTAPREFLAQEALSPGYAYRGAKSRDGMPDVEGSYQAFAFEHFYMVGHVTEALYSYQDAIQNRPLWPVKNAAEHRRIAGFADLLPEPDDFALLPVLMRAVLAGLLHPELGPRPLSVSLALFESMDSYTTRRTGLMTLPLPNEQPKGGHAMSVVGYLDASDPDGLYGVDYFIVRNSWSEAWAPENPLSLPGHALIPAAYFTNPEWVWELLLCIAEPSPALERGRLARAWGALRRALR